MASWSVYIVKCCDGSLYTGVSNDVPNRVLRHNSGRGARYTRSRLPVKLVWRANYRRTPQVERFVQRVVAVGDEAAQRVRTFARTAAKR